MDQPLTYRFGQNWTLVEARDFISRCYDRDALLVTLINFADEWLVGRLVCIVSAHFIQPFLSKGWASWGTDEETTEEMSEVKIMRPGSKILEAIIEQGTYTIGSPSQVGFVELFEHTSVLAPDELVVIPLQLGNRTKMLFLGEPRELPDDLMAFSEDIEPLVTLADEVAQQLEEIIKLAKAKQLPPEDERIPPSPRPLTASSSVVIDDFPLPPQLDEEQSLMDAVSSALDAADLSNARREGLVEETIAAYEALDPRQTATAIPGLGTKKATPPRIKEVEESPAPLISPEPAAVKRKTMPIALDPRETSKLAKLTPAQIEQHKAANEDPKVKSTHMGTPLHLMQQGMFIEEEAELEPAAVSDEHEDLESKLRKSLGDEGSGVAIIEPIGLGDKDQASKTLMGGFSVELLKPTGGDSPFEPREKKTTLRGLQSAPRPEQPRHGMDSPFASMSAEDERSTQKIDLAELDAKLDARKEAKLAAKPPKKSTLLFVQEDLQREFEEADQGRDKATIADMSALPSLEPARPPKHVVLDTDSYAEEIPELELSPLEPLPADGIALDHGEFSTRKMHAVEPEELVEIPVEAIVPAEAVVPVEALVPIQDEAPPEENEELPELQPEPLAPKPSNAPLDPMFGAQSLLGESLSASKNSGDYEEIPSVEIEPIEAPTPQRTAPPAAQVTPAPTPAPARAPQPAPQAKAAVLKPRRPQMSPIVWDALENIESKDRKIAFDAATKLVPHPEVLKKLHQLFPGRLYVDRYQWTPETLPEVSKHGPVLAAIARLGAPCAPILAENLSASRLDTRFYATLLFEGISAGIALEQLRDRLFDRDSQTRAIAQRVLLAQRHLKDFDDLVTMMLRNYIITSPDELHIEVASEMLGLLHDTMSVDLLIETMDEHRNKRAHHAIYEALQRITLQSLPPTSIAWRTWSKSTKNESRKEWLLRGMNSTSDQIRVFVAEELATLKDKGFDYSPTNPPKVRIHQQQQMKQWFDQRTT